MDDKFNVDLLGVDDDWDLEVCLDFVGIPEHDFWLDDLCLEVEGLLVEGFFLFPSMQHQYQRSAF